MSYGSPRSPTIPAAGPFSITNDNNGFFSLRDLMAVDVRTGEERTLIKHGRIGEIVFNPVDRALIGVRHDDGLATLVRIPPPYNRYYEIHTFPYGVVPYDLDISPDGRLLSASVAEVNGDQFLRVWELAEGSGRTTSGRFPNSASASPSRRALRSPRMGATCTAAATTPACPTSSATRSRPVRSRRCPTRKSVSSARCRSPTAGLFVLNYTADGFAPAIDRPAPDHGRQRDHVPGHGDRREVSRRQDVAGAASEHRRRRKAGHADGTVLSGEAASRLDERLSGACRATRTRRESVTTSTSATRSASRTWASPSPTRRATSCRATSARTSISPGATFPGRRLCRTTGRISTICSVPSSAAEKVMPRSSATTGT